MPRLLVTKKSCRRESFTRKPVEILAFHIHVHVQYHFDLTVIYCHQILHGICEFDAD